MRGVGHAIGPWLVRRGHHDEPIDQCGLHHHIRGMRIEQLTALPSQITDLRAEALAEGFDHIDALYQQWQDRRILFERPGEMLTAAFIENELAGIGGITEDFIDSSFLRMRRFYVRPHFRRHGVGKAIASYVLDRAMKHSRPMVLHTDTDRGVAFWQAMGFVPIQREKTTHILPR